MTGGVDVSVAVAGGSVTVGVSVEMPVPGPVMALDGIVVSTALDGGSRMLEMTELMSLRIEVSGLLGSLVLELVTMPVGARMISDVLVVGTGGSSDVD